MSYPFEVPDLAMKVLQRSLDASVVKQKTIATNMANIETPGYKRQYVSFDDELRQALTPRLNHDMERDLEATRPQVRRDFFAYPARQDGNNVAIDAEVMDLSKNQLDFNAIKGLWKIKDLILLSAATEGRK